MSFIQDMMQGYTAKVLGPNAGAAKANDAAQASTAYQQLQAAIAEDYRQQKQNFEAAPENKGKSWNMPDTTERFNDQVQAMIISGNPALQARGLALLDKPDTSTSAADKEFAQLQRENPGLTYAQYFQMKHPGPASTRVNVNLPKMDQPMSIDDLQKLQFPQGTVPIPGWSMAEAGQHGGRIAQTKEQADSAATAGVTSTALDAMNSANSGTTTAPVPAAVSELRNSPGIIGQAANTALNVAGYKQNPADVQFISRRSQVAGNITRMMSGAAASDQDVARVQSMLPSLTDDASTRAIKFKNAADQAKAYVEAAKNKGGQANNAPAAAAPKGPQTRVTKSGVKYTVE